MATSKLVKGTTNNITAAIDAALADGWVPVGPPVMEPDGDMFQLMYKGLATDVGSASAADLTALTARVTAAESAITALDGRVATLEAV